LDKYAGKAVRKLQHVFLKIIITAMWFKRALNGVHYNVIDILHVFPVSIKNQ